jgi:hypothetical protein
MILVGVLVALLVEEVLDYTPFDLAFGGANENGFDAPITWASPLLLISVDRPLGPWRGNADLRGGTERR